MVCINTSIYNYELFVCTVIVGKEVLSQNGVGGFSVAASNKYSGLSLTEKNRLKEIISSQYSSGIVDKPRML